jgi:hypothetical protein
MSESGGAGLPSSGEGAGIGIGGGGGVGDEGDVCSLAFLRGETALAEVPVAGPDDERDSGDHH